MQCGAFVIFYTYTNLHNNILQIYLFIVGLHYKPQDKEKGSRKMNAISHTLKQPGAPYSMKSLFSHYCHFENIIISALIYEGLLTVHLPPRTERL